MYAMSVTQKIGESSVTFEPGALEEAVVQCPVVFQRRRDGDPFWSLALTWMDGVTRYCVGT